MHCRQRKRDVKVRERKEAKKGVAEGREGEREGKRKGDKQRIQR